jgi:hypothetical protein
MGKFFSVKQGRGLDIRTKRTSYFSNSRLAEFLPSLVALWQIKFGKLLNPIDRSVKHLLFIWHFRIVIWATLPHSVSRCGRSGPLLLASFHCYVAHFNCEQELNSTCSRRILDQPTCWRRHALLSNARLTFAPKKFLGIRPSPA